jgi:hypothetical protein
LLILTAPEGRPAQRFFLAVIQIWATEPDIFISAYSPIAMY